MPGGAAARARPVPSRGRTPPRAAPDGAGGGGGRVVVVVVGGGRRFLPAREARPPFAADPRRRGPGPPPPARYGRRSGQGRAGRGLRGAGGWVGPSGLRGAPAAGRGAVGDPRASGV